MLGRTSSFLLPLFSLSLATLAAARATLPDPLLAAYWGQSSGSSLETYCSTGYFNVISIGFAASFGSNAFNFQTDGCTSSSTSSQGCESLGSQISTCQSQGVKILLSMGGATIYDCAASGCTGNYSFTSTGQAATTSTLIWQMFFNNGATTSGVARPFGSTSLDGVDLDIEMTTINNGQSPGQLYYDTFVKNLLARNSNLIIGGAPECQQGSIGPNPMASIVVTTPLDFMFIQFFNNPKCSITSGAFVSTFAAWVAIAAANPNGATKLLLGVPGDTSGATSQSPSYYQSPEQVLSLVSGLRSQYPNAHVGVGVYDAHSAVGSTASGSDPNWAQKVHAGLIGSPVVAAAASPAAVSSPAVLATVIAGVSTAMVPVVANATATGSRGTSSSLFTASLLVASAATGTQSFPSTSALAAQATSSRAAAAATNGANPVKRLNTASVMGGLVMALALL